jgi:chemotaxis signal transduction protein
MSTDHCFGVIRCGTVQIAVPAANLQEVFTAAGPISPLPDAEPWVLGTLLFHGVPIPAIDLPAVLGRTQQDDAVGVARHWVVLKSEAGRYALPAHAATHVVRVSPDAFTELSTVGGQCCFRRIIRVDADVYPVLDVEALANRPGMRLAVCASGETTRTCGDQVSRLVFRAAGHTFAVDLNDVAQVMTCPTLTETGLQSDLLAGFLSTRGRQIGVLNFGTLADLAKPAEPPKFILRLRHSAAEAAFLVEKICAIESQSREPLVVDCAGIPRAELFRGSLLSPEYGSLLVVDTAALLMAPEMQGCLSEDVSVSATESDHKAQRQFIIYRVGGKPLASSIGDFQAIVAPGVDLQPLRARSATCAAIGTLSWQGQAVPVVDLRVLFGEAAGPVDGDCRVLIVRSGGNYRGYLVSCVVSLHAAVPQKHVWPTTERMALPPITHMVPFHHGKGVQNIALLDLPSIRLVDESSPAGDTVAPVQRRVA